MPMIPLAFALLILFLLFAAIPFSLVQRYRLGKARRPGRLWVAGLNLVILIFSIPVFVWTSAITDFWVPNALPSSLLGLFGGVLLGLLGLAVTKWEETPRTLYYTPNRWLVLLLVLAVTARLLYGFVRAWQAWHTAGPDQSWLAAAGVAGSLAVGAVILGYYLSYWAGLCWRLARYRQGLPA